jgi:hypothetical protein
LWRTVVLESVLLVGVGSFAGGVLAHDRNPDLWGRGR